MQCSATSDSAMQCNAKQSKPHPAIPFLVLPLLMFCTAFCTGSSSFLSAFQNRQPGARNLAKICLLFRLKLQSAVVLVRDFLSESESRMPCTDSNWAQLQDALLLDVFAKLSLNDKVRFESVCATWHNLLGDQPVSGAWGNRFLLSHALRRIIPGFLFDGASQHRQLRQTDSLVQWLRRRARSFQAIILGYDSRYRHFEIDQGSIAVWNWLLHQLDQIQGLPALELHVCCSEGRFRFGAYRYRQSQGGY